MTNNIAPLILAVDDDRDFLEIIEAKLVSQGYQVITAANGNDAIAKARAANPAIILMDVEMPEKDGITAASELAVDEKTKSIPTIFVTNLSKETASSLAQRVALHIDSAHYFRKDGDYVFLMKEVQSLIAA